MKYGNQGLVRKTSLSSCFHPRKNTIKRASLASSLQIAVYLLKPKALAFTAGSRGHFLGSRRIFKPSS